MRYRYRYRGRYRTDFRLPLLFSLEGMNFAFREIIIPLKLGHGFRVGNGIGHGIGNARNFLYKVELTLPKNNSCLG